ncbi:hypothetical protein HDV00_002942 [Rhizophlyctis rosea]|nr:hypothetical protein HDV00_002942 [Rhizophlyctis rosea]
MSTNTSIDSSADVPVLPDELIRYIGTFCYSTEFLKLRRLSRATKNAIPSSDTLTCVARHVFLKFTDPFAGLLVTYSKDQNGERIAAIFHHLLSYGASLPDNEQLLLTLASRGLAAPLEILIQNGADIHIYDGEALVLACYYRGNAQTVKLLLEHGADVHAQDDLPIRVAAENNRYDVAIELLNRKANVRVHDNEAIKNAAERGHTDMVKLLLKHGADPNAGNGAPLIAAAEHGWTEMVRTLLEFGATISCRSHSALVGAAGASNEEIVAMLMERGGDPSAQKGRAIRSAAQNGNVAVLRRLIDSRRKGLEQYYGKALEGAARAGQLEAVEFLLERGADVHYKSDEAVKHAALYDHHEVVRALLAAGADKNALKEIPGFVLTA